jgi:hypothetical protein
MASAAATALTIDVLRIFGLRRSSLSPQPPRCKSMKDPFHSRLNDPLTASAYERTCRSKTGTNETEARERSGRLRRRELGQVAS